MLDKVRGRVPQARLTGFSIEEMIKRPQAFELLAGIADDPVFGPVVLFGQGGTAAEIIRDRAIGLPPLNLPLAREMIGRTRVARLLEGYRDRPAAAIDEVALTLVKLSRPPRQALGARSHWDHALAARVAMAVAVAFG